MNTAAPDPSASGWPSDSAIAQAFRDVVEGPFDFGIIDFVSRINRLAKKIEDARPLTISAPAAAVGGDLIEQVTAALITESTNHPHGESPGESWRRLARVAVALCTPAAPVGGFVLSKESNEWWWQRTDHMHPEARDMVRELLRTMTASPAAQAGIDPALEAAAVPLPESISTRVNNLRERAAQSSADILRAGWERECADVDKIIEKLGIPLERARTEGGSLNVPRILNHIQETLDALGNATAFGAHLNDRIAAAQASAKDGARVAAIAFAVMNPTGQVFDISDRLEVAQRSADERNVNYPPTVGVSQAVYVVPLYATAGAGLVDETLAADDWYQEASRQATLRQIADAKLDAVISVADQWSRRVGNINMEEAADEIRAAIGREVSNGR